jgi:hypothetical protein
VNWKVLFGAGCLAGIGFTMSLFIAGLALEGGLLAAGKVGTMFGSALSAVLGLAMLLYFLRRTEGHQAAGSGAADAPASLPPADGGHAVSDLDTEAARRAL